MRMPKFAYLKPTTVQEAIALLSQYDGKAKMIAGGTELVNRIKERVISPSCLIDITYIPGLDTIKYDAKSIKIGINFARLGEIKLIISFLTNLLM